MRIDLEHWFLPSLTRCLDWVVPKSPLLVILTIPDGDDQGAGLCWLLQERGYRLPVVWLTDGDPKELAVWSRRRGLNLPTLRFLKRRTVLGFWYFLRARWLFYTHGGYFSLRPPRAKNVVNLWHGMPIKRIWSDLLGSTVPQPTFLLSTSPFFSDVLMRASGFSADRMLVSGLPRNDFLTRSRAAVSSAGRRLRGEAERLIVFLPTYRKSKLGFITDDGVETGQVLGLEPADADRLHAWLKTHRCKLVVKPHPMSVTAGMSFPSDGQWEMVDETWLLREGIGLYELLSQADLLVTDVSSVAVDFLITGRPQIFYFPDVEKYRQTRGFLVDPLEDYLPGPLTTSYPQLEEELGHWVEGADHWADRRKHLRQLLIPPQERPAAEIILERVGVLAAGPDLKPALDAKSPVAVFVWAQYGPYHFARLGAVQRSGGPFKALGLEIASQSTTYAWQRPEGTNAVHTLCPGVSAEAVSSHEVYRRALKFFREQKAAVVFVPSYWPASSLAVILAAKSSGARCVMMNESHERTAKVQGVFAWLKKKIVRSFDAGLVGGSPQLRHFLKLGLRPDRLFRGYDAVDNAYFAHSASAAREEAQSLRSVYGLPPRYFLSIGRMEKKKNLQLLVEAYAWFKARYDAQSRGLRAPGLIFVGSGTEEPALRSLCAKLGLAIVDCSGYGPSRPMNREIGADVGFYGFRQIAELPSFYALAEAFILPSHEEEWGLVVNEAMACGCAVLVSAHAGCCEDLVEEGANGWSFHPGRSEELGSHMLKLAEEPQLSRRMGEAGAAKIKDWGCEVFAENAVRAARAALDS